MRAYRVLFVCYGNACRSQMAEAFARAYGEGVLIPHSAGLHPAGMVSPVSARLMLEKNISLDGHWSKGFGQTGLDFDLVVNMSGLPLPREVSAQTLEMEWAVEDPIGLPEIRQREIRERIDLLVRALIEELR
jgi:protein-tyrosine-phosphatase